MSAVPYEVIITFFLAVLRIELASRWGRRDGVFAFPLKRTFSCYARSASRIPYKAPRLWCAIAEQLSRTLGKPALLGEIFDMARSHGYRIHPSAAKKAAGTGGLLSRASSQPSSRIDRGECGAASVAGDLAAASLPVEPDRNGFTGFGQQRNLGGKRNADRCLKFLERRLALEAETRQREAAQEDRRLAIEERRLALQESQLQLDIGVHLQRVREFEEAHETRRQERAMLSQQNELLANVLRALVEKLTK
ncbi:hypothetical protein MRX96_050856 [Rhipicephalus microplus]